MVDELSPGTEDPSRLVVEEVRVFDFDLATAVVPTVDGFTATVDPGWTIGSRPNGGYLLALATRAALAVTGQPHPLAVSAHFVAPPSIGPTDLEVRLLRSGSSVASSRVTLVQDGQPRLEALVSAGRLERDDQPEWSADPGPPDLAPVEECVRGRTELPGGIRVAMMDHLDVRVDPSAVGWLEGDPSGSLRMLGWVRFIDDRPPDPLAMLQAIDALPPASFELGIVRWAPTVEMSVYIRALPADGWLRCFVRGKLLQGGWFDEEAEVWDQHGRLVAQSRQLAGARTDRSPQPRTQRWAQRWAQRQPRRVQAQRPVPAQTGPQTPDEPVRVEAPDEPAPVQAEAPDGAVRAEASDEPAVGEASDELVRVEAPGELVRVEVTDGAATASEETSRAPERARPAPG